MARATTGALRLVEDRFTEYMVLASAYFKSLEICPRVPDRYPFDFVALELLSKSFSVARACMILLKEAQPDEAYSLSRTLVECALILRHLTRNEQEKFSESAKFIEFSRTTKNFWLHHVRRNIAGDLSDQDTSRYAEEWGLSDAKPREIFRGWSGDFQTFDCLKKDHPLDAPNTLDVRISAHAVDYTQPSQFVHCSQQALDNFAPNIGVPYQLKSSVGESVDTHPHVLFILITYLHEVVNYCLFGLALDRPDSLDRHFNKTLQQIVQLDD